MANNVYLKAAATTVTDGGSSSPNLAYYDFMTGFYYPPELETTVVTAGGWRGIQ